MQKYTIAIISFLLLFLQLDLSFAEPSLTARVDSNKVVENTSFRLYVELKDKSFSGTPDFSALEKNFRVVSTMRSQSTSWINGTKSSKTIWQLILMPDKIGKLTIPKIYVTDLSSEPITIEVVESSTGNADEKPRLAYLEVDADNKSPLVQSMVELTVRLHHAPSLTDGTLTEPVVKDAIVVPIGRDKRYKKNTNGIVFYVLERKYAIFPQSSGPLSITAPVFDGMFTDNDMGFRSFDEMFKINVNAMPVRATHPEVELNVKKAPNAENLQHWLPASHLKINQTWEAKGKLRQGEPIVRTITVKAAKFTAEQLPNLVDLEVEGANHYTDAPKFENTTEDGQILGTRIDSFTYIPINDGEIEFPAINLKWWDTDTNSFKTAKLPSKKFTILPVEKVEEPKTTFVEAPVVSQPIKQDNNIWMYITIMLTILWLLTILVWLFKRSKLKSTISLPGIFNKEKDSNKYRLLKDSCLSNNKDLTQKIIIEIIQDKTGVKANNLSEASYFVSKELAQEFKLLEEKMYSRVDLDWDGSVLWQLFEQEKFKKKTTDTSKKDDLPSLNP
jgi:hypothetical protein